jgi:hypothetical protein
MESTTAAPQTTPFRTLPLAGRSPLQRLLDRRPRENAWIEVNNLLAETRDVRAVRPEQVARIAERYRIPLRGEFCGRLERLYRDYLLFCLADRRLTDDELCDLAHLKRIFRLSDTVVSAIHESVARQVYSHSVDEVLADGRIDPREREFLHTLQQHLALSGRVAQRIIEQKKRALEL